MIQEENFREGWECNLSRCKRKFPASFPRVKRKEGVWWVHCVPWGHCSVPEVGPAVGCDGRWMRWVSKGFQALGGKSQQNNLCASGEQNKHPGTGRNSFHLGEIYSYFVLNLVKSDQRQACCIPPRLVSKCLSCSCPFLIPLCYWQAEYAKCFISAGVSTSAASSSEKFSFISEQRQDLCSFQKTIFNLHSKSWQEKSNVEGELLFHKITECPSDVADPRAEHRTSLMFNS